MIDVYQHNFDRFGCKAINATVQEMNWGEIGGDVCLMQSSPVCSNFSQAKTNAKEHVVDLSQAIAIIEGIKRLKPQHFVLENVPGYRNSESFKLIIQALSDQNYSYHWAILNLSDYGVPQERKRLFLLASDANSQMMRFPPLQRRVGWADVIDWDETIECQPTDRQSLSLSDRLLWSAENSVLVERYGISSSARNLQIKGEHQPCWTLTRSMFTDGRSGGRKMCIGGWDSLLGWFYLPFNQIKKIAGFPDWYELPEDKPGVSGSILGYSVPPSFISLLLNTNFA